MSVDYDRVRYGLNLKSYHSKSNHVRIGNFVSLDGSNNDVRCWLLYLDFGWF